MDVRASDAEREATIERLRHAAAKGRLTFEELADRIEAASAAVMRSDLAPLTADLPAALPATPAEPARVHSIGDVKRSGAWVVPADNRFAPGSATSSSTCVRRGSAARRSRNPRVDAVRHDRPARARGGWRSMSRPAPSSASSSSQTSDVTVPGAPRIVLTGGSVFGVVRVRNKRLWEKLASRLLS